jgi:hypothetical protein
MKTEDILKLLREADIPPPISTAHLVVPADEAAKTPPALVLSQIRATLAREWGRVAVERAQFLSEEVADGELAGLHARTGIVICEPAMLALAFVQAFELGARHGAETMLARISEQLKAAGVLIEATPATAPKREATDAVH